MNSTPPFEVIDIAGGRVYRLPPRQLGLLRWLAAVPLVLAGAGCVFFALRFIPIANGQLDEIWWVALVVLGLFWARAFYSLVSIAAAIWCGRTEIELRDDGAVRAVDRVGWFRVRWGRLQPGAARQVLLTELTPVRDSAGKALPLPGQFWHLSVATARGKKVWLAPGHARGVLAPLADVLAKQLALAAPATCAPEDDSPPTPLAKAPLPVIVEESAAPNRDVLDQPPTSLVVVEYQPGGATVTVPPLGVRRANGGLVLLGLIFAAIGACVTIGTVAALVQAKPKVPIAAIIVGFAFSCIGGGMVISCIHAGRKRVVLAVVGDQLLTFETGPLGSRRREFTRDDLTDIACGPSNISVNNKPLPQLQFFTRDGQKQGMLTNRDEVELKWIATVLRQSLGISGIPPEYRAPINTSGTPDAR